MATEETKQKILIIEDDFFIRELYEREFRNSGYAVFIASDGAEGLLKIEEEMPDIVLLDLMLPKLNGLDLLKTVKEKEELKKVPIVILTNVGQEPAIKRGFELGAAGYMVKSAYTPQQVVNEVKTYLK
ncbi:MAG: hypothetical protein A2Y57_01070 [Candidatus Woykebacteria bacterium RBG_13_40_7b]|uniref:Response regulatory domain-containing protein n=1 Tax=Candidatus Woykebacteria bacterium RBG_13_40_7b TaxID=1802594 RepID=A0A1G1W8A9_9BACT|nr:MAG: hypothetical protein A2Y57_01070 [Candidatus Woykebacteria bacterium RBG_13_40_7b]